LVALAEPGRGKVPYSSVHFPSWRTETGGRKHANVAYSVLFLLWGGLIWASAHLAFRKGREVVEGAVLGAFGPLVSLARKRALNSRGMFSEPATHLLVGPCPFNGVGVPMVVFRPRSQNMRLEFLLTLPGRTFQVIVFKRMNQDFCLV